ncbi:MAG: Stk1 family PASTA domain-containing Ser/Thr kinase [Bacilli bacterium]
MIVKGQKISDRYEIIGNIGEGGMANVFLAHDIILDRDVAIKVLRGDLSNDEKFVRRFQREALSASSLSHPNIVEMYDVGEDSGNYYIVMEYVDGKTLKQLIKRRGALTISEAIDIMLQITDGISHAHDSYIIHRDLKPQNIMIKEDGLIKITDFGIAMALNSAQLTQTNSVMGSVHYLPPEQASGKGSTIKSDIYSMGIVFYELLTGVLPFKGDNAVEIALKHMKDPLPSIRLQNPKIPQSIENIILKASAKNPKNRYASVKDMRSDLLTCLNDEKINEPVVEYKYEETDSDDTKIIPIIKKTKEDFIAEPIVDEEIKKSNVWLWILTSIFGLIMLGLVGMFLIVPMLTEIPDVKVPNVVGLTVQKAEEKLKKVGFEVRLETERIESENIAEGKVVKTNPAIGRSIKKGSFITIYESIGIDSFEMGDYIGKNYIEIKAILENVHKLIVKIEKKDVDTEVKEYGEQEIVGQSVEKGKKVIAGDKVTLFIPNIILSYPDMVKDMWKLSDVEAFCTSNKITLTVEYKETSSFPKDTVMEQSRSYKTPVVKGSTLKVIIAKEPNKPTNPGGDPNLDNIMP